jgi:hypothetical protein
MEDSALFCGELEQEASRNAHPAAKSKEWNFIFVFLWLVQNYLIPALCRVWNAGK